MDEQGNILTKGDEIFCQKQPFEVTEEGYIDYYSSGVMANIFQDPDSESVALQEKVKCHKLQKRRSLIGRMFYLSQAILNLLKQVAIHKISKENSKDVVKFGNDTLDGSYINKNNEDKAKGMATESDAITENAKQLVIVNFNKKCDEYFSEIFYNIDIENKELIKPLMEEYNSKVKNLLFRYTG